MKYFLYKLSKENYEINNNENQIVLSSTITKPIMSLGFQYFINRTKLSTNILSNLDNQSNFYNIINPFEHIIQNSEDLLQITNKFYKKNLEIKSHDFYIIYEILYIFSKSITMTNVLLLDKYEDIIKSISVNYKSKIDIYKNKTTNETYNLIIGFDDLNSNIDDIHEEQNSYRLLINEIHKIVKFQKNGGCTIIKFFESYTIPTAKLIYLLSSLYENVYIIKPFFSRHTRSDKYLVCINYIKQNNIEKIMEKCISEYSKDYLFDIFPYITLKKEFVQNLLFINLNLSNKQFITLNKIIKYIKGNNYFGELYHKYKKNQIDNTVLWNNMFFNKKLTEDIISTFLKDNMNELNYFLEELSYKY